MRHVCRLALDNMTQRFGHRLCHFSPIVAIKKYTEVIQVLRHNCVGGRNYIVKNFFFATDESFSLEMKHKKRNHRGGQKIVQ